MDLHFVAAGIEANFAPLYEILDRVPVPSIRHLFDSKRRSHEVSPLSPWQILRGVADSIHKFGRKALERYLSTYGRESGRKDLLSKVVCLKSETGEPNLTDLEIYTEIANLVAAGTGNQSTESLCASG